MKHQNYTSWGQCNLNDHSLFQIEAERLSLDVGDKSAELKIVHKDTRLASRVIEQVNDIAGIKIIYAEVGWDVTSFGPDNVGQDYFPTLIEVDEENNTALVVARKSPDAWYLTAVRRK